MAKKQMPNAAAYLTIQTADGNAHVLPVSLVRDWISGEQRIDDADDWQLLVRRICEEWLRRVVGETGFVQIELGEPSSN